MQTTLATVTLRSSFVDTAFNDQVISMTMGTRWFSHADSLTGPSKITDQFVLAAGVWALVDLARTRNTPTYRLYHCIKAD